MLHKIKQFLGIEGIKIKLDLPPTLPSKATHFDGVLRLQTMHTQTVVSLRVALVERYTRGRGKNRQTEEISLGEIQVQQAIEVPANQPLEVPFTVVFQRSPSRMDSLSQIPVAGKIADAAKWIAAASSEFYVIAEANVKGTVLQPFDKQTIAFK